MGEITHAKQRALLFCLHCIYCKHNNNAWNGRNGFNRTRERVERKKNIGRNTESIELNGIAHCMFVHTIILNIMCSIMMCTHRKMYMRECKEEMPY